MTEEKGGKYQHRNEGKYEKLKKIEYGVNKPAFFFLGLLLLFRIISYFFIFDLFGKKLPVPVVLGNYGKLPRLRIVITIPIGIKRAVNFMLRVCSFVNEVLGSFYYIGLFDPLLRLTLVFFTFFGCCLLGRVGS